MRPLTAAALTWQDNQSADPWTIFFMGLENDVTDTTSPQATQWSAYYDPATLQFRDGKRFDPDIDEVMTEENALVWLCKGSALRATIALYEPLPSRHGLRS